MRSLLSLLVAAAVLVPGIVLAANLSVYPASITLKKGDSVGFIVRLQSHDSINTVGTAVTLPRSLVFLSATDGTALGDWIEHPTFDTATNAVSFSGIMPNGWSGDGTLAVIKVAAKEAGTYSLSFDQSQTEVYKNDGKATPEPVAYAVAPVSVFALPVPAWGGVILLVVILLVLLLRRRYRVTLI